MDSIVASAITGGLALIGVIITNIMSNIKIQHKLEVNQAVTDTKLDNLAREVREHNSDVQQIPVIQRDIESLERRIDKLEDDNK